MVKTVGTNAKDEAAYSFPGEGKTSLSIGR
jgi:hypothetical protein